MGHKVARSPWVIDVIRTTMTRNLHACFPDCREEIICAFDDVLRVTGSGTRVILNTAFTSSHMLDPEWKAIEALPAMMEIVSRVSNRLFVASGKTSLTILY